MDLNKWGVSALIALIIIVGLFLRYGKSSHYLVNDFFTGTTNWIKTLTLSGMPGNNP